MGGALCMLHPLPITHKGMVKGLILHVWVEPVIRHKYTMYMETTS